jgi:hypothetical protein
MRLTRTKVGRPAAAGRLPSDAGIAIGPILFILALLALLAAVLASGSSDFQVAGSADRITADIVAQANLIRGAINQCNMEYTLDVSTGSVQPVTNSYPPSDPREGTAVSALGCPAVGKPSLWGDMLLPPPTSGFNPWTYIDASESGSGRCIWTTPSSPNPAGNESITSGLTRAATKFNSATAYSPQSESLYDPKSASQKFIIWITMPQGSPDNHCLP